MRFGIALTALALTAGSLATSAQAATINGSVALGSSAVGNGADLNTSTAFTFSTRAGGANTANINATTGDYNNLTGTFATITPIPVTTASPITLTFDGQGAFTGTITSLSRTGGPGGAEFLSITYLGTFTPTATFGGGTFTPTLSGLSVTFTQASSTAAIGVGFSLQSPPVGVPEPASRGAWPASAWSASPGSR